MNRILISSCLCFLVLRLVPLSTIYFEQNHFLSLFQEHLRIFDFAIVFGSFFLFLRIYKIRFQDRIGSILTLSIAAGLILSFPALFWGVFVFSHNFSAFYFWFHHAPKKSEKFTSSIALTVFIMIHGLILLGFFDPIIFSIPINQQPTLNFNYSFLAISSDLFSDLTDLHWGRKIVMLLAFGQSLHYLLWLKVIPECRLSQEKPVSFRMTFSIWKKEWGKNTASIFLLMIFGFFLFGLLGISGLWVDSLLTSFIRIDRVNEIFFAFAFFHIYAEFLAICLAKKKPGCQPQYDNLA